MPFPANSDSTRAPRRRLPIAACGMLVLLLTCGFDAAQARALRVASPSDTDAEFIVPVAALADPRNLKALVDRLWAARIPYYVQPIVTVRGTVYRVRVGPFADRAQAERARERLEGMRLSPDEVIERK